MRLGRVELSLVSFSFDDELFDAYRMAYKGLDDIKVDVKSPNGTYELGTNVTPYQAVDLIQNWLKEQGLY